MSRLLLTTIILILFVLTPVVAQVEHVPVSNPVYSFLLHAETKGLTPHFSLSSLPLQRSQIIDALKEIRKQRSYLSRAGISTLEKYEAEFGVAPAPGAVLIFSSTDTNQVLSNRFFSADEKFIYRYQDSSSSVRVSPLGSIETYFKIEDVGGARNVATGNLGLRVSGSLDNALGFSIQATNGSVLAGERALALEDPKLNQNVKFAALNSDFDFSESHVRFQLDWFYAIIGRETRLMGAGLGQRMFISTNAPPFDALSLGARFSSFEYRFTHASLLGASTGYHQVGMETEIPPKYAAIHRFALRPSWGEIAFWENIIYSGRNPDLAYLNPLSFFKSLEHALRDRDNSIMGGDIVVRPFRGLQLKGSFLLDDIIFGKIGEGYWSNKTAWNIAALAALPGAIDAGAEYSRVEPYTFSHFNPQNSMTNDLLVFGSYLPPNSDQFLLRLQWWWGNRYPVEMNVSYARHGNNIYDENDSLICNVGGDALQTRRPYDPETEFPGDPTTLKFLDGRLVETFRWQIGAGWEFVRGFNLHAYYKLESSGGEIDHGFRIIFRVNDF